ncbi:phage tail tape measure protein [Bacteroides fragilis]|uniref:phage tail tape measure protein n=1 Tax=Bacteroides fragilis TaxID=817 RepID=UPI0020372D07|nr:phage tail tape measure protein [Bacteroides fragilis]USA59722.1 phage tail tape measure protein [Bacteroides fragilis]
MANDLNRSIKLYIDGSEATNRIDLVKESISRLEDKLRSLTGKEVDYAKRSQDLKKELDAKNRTLQNYEKQLAETERVLKSLSGATYNELLAVQSRVRKELRNAVPGTKQYTAALEQNRRVIEALSRAQANMRVEVGAQGNIWSRASGFINKYIGLIGTVIAAITGVSMKLNQLREQRNKREEAKADVEALTGLSKDDINWLEQQAVQLSTTMTESGIRIRQSATEILDAYKLVGSAKPELLDNKEALAEVTKQTLILASASGMTLKDAVDAVTLSLNQYGDGADQASRYANVMAAGSKYGAAAVESVTTAVTKSGVAAASAEIPIEQLVGTIETLAEKGIKDEIAGTGLKKFFLTLQTGADDTNPKIVGLEKALDNLQKKQLSAAQIKKQFGEEGYNVASVLINEADKVKYYTQAVTGTSVAMEQAATKSETAAAKLSQAKNRMQELGIELLEKLNPALISAANGAVSWTGKLIKLLNFINENKRAITLLTIALIAYTAAKNSDVIISKVVTFWNNNIAKSLKAIKKELMTNPYGIIAVVGPQL